jgi:hypothetical protein
MTAEDGRIRRRKEALRVFSEQPNYFAQPIRDAILANRVISGMTPYDVHLAVGAFSFKLMADRQQWPKDANPWDVMWAQTFAPDQSQIWLMFDSALQQPELGQRRYQAVLQAGRVVQLNLLPERMPEPVAELATEPAEESATEAATEPVAKAAAALPPQERRA